MLFITNQEYETALQNGKGNIESKAVVLAQPNRLKLLNKQVNIPRGGIIKLYNVHTWRPRDFSRAVGGNIQPNGYTLYSQ